MYIVTSSPHFKYRILICLLLRSFLVMALRIESLEIWVKWWLHETYFCNLPVSGSASCRQFCSSVQKPGGWPTLSSGEGEEIYPSPGVEQITFKGWTMHSVGVRGGDSMLWQAMVEEGSRTGDEPRAAKNQSHFRELGDCTSTILIHKTSILEKFSQKLELDFMKEHLMVYWARI